MKPFQQFNNRVSDLTDQRFSPVYCFTLHHWFIASESSITFCKWCEHHARIPCLRMDFRNIWICQLNMQTEMHSNACQKYAVNVQKELICIYPNLRAAEKYCEWHATKCSAQRLQSHMWKCFVESGASVRTHGIIHFVRIHESQRFSSRFKNISIFYPSENGEFQLI